MTDMVVVPSVWVERQQRAMVVGGTRGIGEAIAARLRDNGWLVRATGRQDFDIGEPDTWHAYMGGVSEVFDLVVFSASVLVPTKWNHKSIMDYDQAFRVMVSGPALFLARYAERFPWWAKVVMISSVGAGNEGTVDAAYSAAKAAMERFAVTLRGSTSWRVYTPRLDLVDTTLLDLLPPETLHGRPIMTKDEAAEMVLGEAGIL